MKIYLHIGAGKCASSSLQTIWSKNPNLSTKVIYGAIDAEGNIKTGQSIVDESNRNEFDYVSSISLIDLVGNANKEINLLKSIANLSKHYEALVLSNEGWINEIQLINQLSIILLNYEVEIIFIIRSPLEWLNSAWWQWGAWCNVEVEKWIQSNTKNVMWYDIYMKLKEIELLSNIHVFNLSSNIVNDIFSLLNCKNSTLLQKYNSASGYKLLSIFQKRRNLRPSAHQCQLEFSVNRHLTDTGKPNWVISKNLAQKIIDITNGSNKKICDLVINKNTMLDDHRWWNPEYYSNMECDLNSELSKDDLLDMLEDALNAINKLDMKIRRMT